VDVLFIQTSHGSVSEVLVREEASIVSQQQSAHCLVQAVKVSALNVVPNLSQNASGLRCVGTEGGAATVAEGVGARRLGVVRVQPLQYYHRERERKKL
jgi:hypothetical protein